MTKLPSRFESIALLLPILLILVFVFYHLSNRVSTFFLGIGPTFQQISRPTPKVGVKENSFRILSPNKSAILATTSAKIVGTGVGVSLTVILGCVNQKEIIIESFSELQADCPLQEGPNDIRVFNFDKDYRRKEETLSLYVTKDPSLKSSETESALVGTIYSIKNAFLTLDDRKGKFSLKFLPETKIINPKNLSIKVEDLRIADKVMIFHTSGNALSIFQYPLGSTLFNPVVTISNFKEVIGQTLIVPNLERREDQPRHLKITLKTEVKTLDGSKVSLDKVKFGTKLIAIGHYDDYKNIILDSIVLTDNEWMKEEPLRTSTVSASPIP